MKTLFCSLLMFIPMLVMGQGAKLNEGLSLKYIYQAPPKSNGHSPIVIFLHGYGSNEADLFGLKDFFPPNYIIVSARAPYAAGNKDGYEWFDIGSVNAADGKKNEKYEHSRTLITGFINEIVARFGETAHPEVYLVGFSQGAMMSYAVGLIKPELVKGIAVLSGRLFPQVREKVTMTRYLTMLKIFISHGTTDDRIPFSEGKAAADYLKGLGLKPEFHTYTGMGHSISNDVMKDLVNWLKK